MQGIIYIVIRYNCIPARPSNPRTGGKIEMGKYGLDDVQVYDAG